MIRARSKTVDSKEKAKFRQTASWKNFRKVMKKLRKVDFLTDKPLIKGFQVHHCDESLQNYKELESDKFYTLNRTSHEVVHWAERYRWEILILKLACVLFKMDKYQPKEKDEQQVRVADKLKLIIQEEGIE